MKELLNKSFDRAFISTYNKKELQQILISIALVIIGFILVWGNLQGVMEITKFIIGIIMIIMGLSQLSKLKAVDDILNNLKGGENAKTSNIENKTFLMKFVKNFLIVSQN